MGRYGKVDNSDNSSLWACSSTVASVFAVIVGIVLVGIVSAMYVQQKHIASDVNALQPDSTESEAAAAVHSSATGCLAGYTATSADQTCDVVIVGAGPAGLYQAYRLAPLLKDKLCIVERLDRVGGKVHSVAAPTSTTANPLYSPTCAEQYRGTDVQWRCLASELGIVSYVRGSLGSYIEQFARGRNGTLAWSLDNAGLAIEDAVAPNGRIIVKDKDGKNVTANTAFPNLKRYCASNTDPTTCSYDTAIWDAMYDSANAASLDASASLTDYVQRIAGGDGMEYLYSVDGLTYEFDYNHQAINALDYFEYDESQPWAALYVTKGGPAQVLNAMATKITGNNSRIYLSESGKCFDKATDNLAKTYPYVVRTDKRNFRAKYVVFAMPAGEFKQHISGTLGTQMAQHQIIQNITSIPAATHNMFFPTKWWQPTRSQCLQGYCTLLSNITSTLRDHMLWTYINADESCIGFAQYIPTPERNASNLLRVFIDKRRCYEVTVGLFNRGGHAAVTSFIMSELRRAFPNETIPEPTAAHFSHQPHGYTQTNPGTTVSNADIEAYAKLPLSGEKVCFASESFRQRDSGWQGAAAISATNCLSSGGGLAGLVPTVTMNKWNSCSTSNPLSTCQTLSLSNSQSTLNPCCMTNTEVHMRNLAGISYCTGNGNSKRSIDAVDDTEYLLKQMSSFKKIILL